MKLLNKLLFTLLIAANLSVKGQNIEVKPGDDFYLYVNKTWLDTTQNPVGTLKTIDEATNQQLLKVIQKNAQNQRLAKNSPEKKLADYYNSGLDTTKIEKRGLTPLLKYFSRIDNTKNRDDFFNLLATLRTEGQNHFLGIDINQDDKNSQYYTLSLSQNGLTLGVPTVYAAEGEIYNKVRNSYKKYLQTIFELIGNPKNKSEKIANDIFDFEKDMALSFMTDADLYNPDLSYNKMSVHELEKLTPRIHWSDLFKIMDIKTDSIVVQNPKYFLALNSLIENRDLDIWKNKLKAYIIASRATALSFPFREAVAELKSVFAPKVYNPRPKELLSKLNNQILGKLYAEEYSDQQSKKKIESMALGIKEAFNKRIVNNQWMTAETKKEALKKLNALRFKIGYPEKIDDFKGLAIDPDLFFENMDSWSAYNFRLKTAKINKKVDKDKWTEALPQTVNAYYDPLNNEVIVPASLLQEPLFSKKYTDAVLYGSIGYIIGHELTHGFDKNGKKYDHKGNLKNWWNEKDEKSFESLCTKLVEQFNQYEVADKIYINGTATLPENTADLGGLGLAYDAYKLTETGKNNDKQLDKQFFIAFAKVWREKLTAQQLKNIVMRDTHAPPQWRINGILSNFTPFYRTFDIDKNDKLYKDEKDRIIIW